MAAAPGLIPHTRYVARRALGAATVAATLLVARPAGAHGAANLGDFYAGLAQPLFHPESLLLLLALGLWSGQTPAHPRFEAPLAFAAAAVIGGVTAILGVAVPGTLATVRCGALAIGALVALRWHPPFAGMLVIGALLGAAQGHFGAYADRADIGRPVLFAIGLGVGPVLVAGWFVALTDRFRAPWIQIGVRVAGSWIATISLLASVLALTKGAR